MKQKKILQKNKNAIITIKNYYSIQKMVKEYEKIYKEIYLKVKESFFNY